MERPVKGKEGIGMRRSLFEKFILVMGMAVAMLFAGAGQAVTAFTGTGTLCWIDPTAAVELPSGPIAGLVFFFKVETTDDRLTGWQINHETHDVKKNDRGTVMGHLELYPEDYAPSILTGIYAFKNTAPSFSSYYLGTGGDLDGLVVEYEVSDDREVSTCPEVPGPECDGYMCFPLDPGAPPGFGVETNVSGTIYD